MPTIQIMVGEEPIGEVPVSGPVVIGRTAECDVMVPDTEVSRRHCRIEPAEDGWCVTDLGSKNGVVIDGERVAARHVLTDGQQVRLGRTLLTFHLDDAHLRQKFAARVRSSTQAATLSDDDVLDVLDRDAPSPDDDLLLGHDEQPPAELLDPSEHDADVATPEVATPPATKVTPLRAAEPSIVATDPVSPSTDARPAEDSFSAVLKQINAASPAEREVDVDGAADRKWYRRKIPTPVFYVAAGILAAVCAWEFYVNLLAGPQHVQPTHRASVARQSAAAK